MLLLCPIICVVLELTAGPMGFTLGTICCPQLGFFVIRIFPLLFPALVVIAWAKRAYTRRRYLVIFTVVMLLLWIINLIGLFKFIDFGLNFHHGDLLE